MALQHLLSSELILSDPCMELQDLLLLSETQHIFLLTNTVSLQRTPGPCFRKQAQPTLSLILISELIEPEMEKLSFRFQNS